MSKQNLDSKNEPQTEQLSLWTQ